MYAQNRVRSSIGMAALAAIVTAIVCLASVVACWAVSLADQGASHPGGDITVAIWPRGLERGDAAGARSVEIISAMRGVSRVEELEPDSSDEWGGALIRGSTHLDKEVRLIVVKIRHQQSVSASTISERLREGGVTAAVDYHWGTPGPLERAAWLTVVGAVGLILIASSVFFFICRMIGKDAVVRDHRRSALMARLGARPAIIGALATSWAWYAAISGALLAIATFAAFGSTVSLAFVREHLVQPPLLCLLVVAPWPILLFILATVGSRSGARTQLKDDGLT